MSTKRKVEEQFKRIEKQMQLEIYLSLNPELVERMDEVVELLGLESIEELVRCAIQRYLDMYPPLAKKSHY